MTSIGCPCGQLQERHELGFDIADFEQRALLYVMQDVSGSVYRVCLWCSVQVL